MTAKESRIQRALGMAVFCALIIAALAWTGMYTLAGNVGQNKNADTKKEKIEDVTEREGERFKARRGYELFKEGNKIYARKYGADTKAPRPEHSISCACDGNGTCIPVTDGKIAKCADESNDRCAHCQISVSQ